MKPSERKRKFRLKIISILLTALSIFLVIGMLIPSAPVIADTRVSEVSIGDTKQSLDIQDPLNIEVPNDKSEDKKEENDPLDNTKTKEVDNNSDDLNKESNDTTEEIVEDKKEEKTGEDVKEESSKESTALDKEVGESQQKLIEEQEVEEKSDAQSNKVVEDTSEVDEDKETELEKLQALRAGRALKSNETVVDTFQQLKETIEKSGFGLYDTIYFGADITATGGISIPNGYQFTIDGTDPTTGKKYTYYEYASASSGYNIWYPGSASIEHIVNVQNMIIEGQNYYGVVGSTSRNFTVNYINVDYTGPEIAYTKYGKSTIRDSRINIVTGRRSTANEVIEGAQGELSGHNIITMDSAYRAFDVSDTLVFKSGSINEFYINTDLFYSTKIDVLVEKDAVVQVRDNPQSPGGSKEVMNGGTLVNHGTIDIQIPNIATSAIVMWVSMYNTGLVNIVSDTIGKYGINVRPSGSDTFVNDGGTINITANKTGDWIIYSFSMILINNSTMNIDVNEHSPSTAFKIYTISEITNSTVSMYFGKTSASSKTSAITSDILNITDGRIMIDTGRVSYSQIFDSSKEWSFISTRTVPSYLVIQDNSGAALVDTGTKTASIDTQQINTWTTKPDFLEYPNQFLLASERLYFRDGRNLDVQFKLHSGKISSITSTTPQTDFTPVSQLTFVNRKVTAMGYMKLDVSDQLIASNHLEAKTNPHAWVKLDASPNAYYTYADGSGTVDDVLDNPVPNGTYTISAFGNYLYREVTMKYFVDGILEIEKIPTTLDFGKAQLENNGQTYPRLTSDEIIISDERAHKTGWKLVVYIEETLAIPQKPNTALPESLVYKNPSTNQTQTITSKPMTVYETSGTSYDTKTTIPWSKDNGIQLFIKNYNEVYANEEYHAKLIWELQEK